MCGRYTALTEDEIIEIREILKKLSLEIVRDDFNDYSAAQGEVFPTDSAPIISGDKNGISFQNAKWGFKKWNSPGVIINARAETIKTKAAFSKHLENGRCVVPAGEFFEWQRLENEKIKYYAKDREGNLLFMAGLYKLVPDEDNPGVLRREFVIITKEAIGEMSKIHNRMPVILTTEQIEPWLTGKIKPEDIQNFKYDVSIFPCENNE